MVTKHFIIGLLVILVVIEKFTKYIPFISLQHPFNAQKVADVLVDNV